MHTKNSLLRMMLLVLALCILMCAAALAENTDFTFVLNSAQDGYVVTGYSGSDATVTVPDWYEQMPVTEIGAGAFENNTTIQKVAMPDTIVRIGGAAFKNCTNLTQITSYSAADEPPQPDHTAGDANGDGVVNIMDALLVLQYDAGWNVSIDKTNADVDANSGVDFNDAILILQYGAGQDVTLK